MKKQKLISGLLWISVIAFIISSIFGYIAAKAKLEESAKQRDIQHQKDLEVMASNFVRGIIEVKVAKALDEEVARQITEATKPK